MRRLLFGLVVCGGCAARSTTPRAPHQDQLPAPDFSRPDQVRDLDWILWRALRPGEPLPGSAKRAGSRR